MAHLCQYCQKPFSRSYNRDRHEKRGCWKRLEQQQGESTTMATVSPEDVVSEVGSDEGSINEDSEDKENDDEDMEIDSEDEDDSEVEYDIVDPWEDFRAKVKESLSSRFKKQVEWLVEKGASEAVAQAKAFNALLPVFRAKLRRLYLHYLKWFRRLKRDPVHEAVMKTLRRFMHEEEDMDYEEAADAAVDRRKFLLNRIFHPRPVPKNEEEKEEEEEEEKEKEEEEEEEEDEEDKES